MISIADGIGLLIGIVVIATIADRLRIPYPILLVIAGIGVALIPTQHRVELQPELVLLVFLPPLIYDASLDTSAREVRSQIRPILFLAVGLVVATMTVVAVVIHSMVHDMSWAVAFALGAIVSPPDSVAATQIAGKLGLPRRLVTILGGEGMMNDATALTAYQVAVAAVGSAFTVADVAWKFSFAVVAGVGIGLAVGWLGARVLRFTETPVIENTMLLILPFAAYLPADKLGASGVLAVVAAGLYFGRYGSSSLTAGARLQQREIWDLVVFLLTGMSFLLVGLELRPILDSLTNRESGSLALEALAVIGVVMVVRIVWIFGATAVPGAQRLLGSGRRPTHPWREIDGDRLGGHAWSGEPGRVAGPAPFVPASGPAGLPDLRRHRGHAGGPGPDPPVADPPTRPGDTRRAGGDAGRRGPATADGGGPDQPRRPRPRRAVPRRGGGPHPHRVRVPAGPHRSSAGGAGVGGTGTGTGPTRGEVTGSPPATGVICTPSVSCASW